MRGVSHTLRRFGFKQVLRGAIIIGLLAGFMLTLQGVAYQKAYPDAITQAKFAASLQAAPALGFLYGQPQNLSAGTQGYMYYRVVGFMGLVAGIWGLMVATRLLRGNEEDGRWEMLRSSSTTARGATLNVISGFLLAWLGAGILSTIITELAAKSAGITLSLQTNVLINILIFLPALLFAGVGVLTSQLALTRQRAIMYGLVPIVALFLIRGVGIVKPSLAWLLNLTPFGWVELANPILHPNNWWLLPFVVGGAIFLSLGIWFSQRDLDSSVFKQSPTSRSKFYLLGGSWQIGLRQNLLAFAGWALAAFTITGLIAALTTIAVNATDNSGSLSQSIQNLSSNSDDFKIAFLGAGMVFLAMVLLIMAITVIGGIRRDEAKQYLDNILIQPISRTYWLASRLLLGLSVILAISLASGLLTFTVARGNHIDLSLTKVLAASVSVVGTSIFMLGLGGLLYGLWPRLATPILYAVVVWSFVITLVSAATHLNSVLLHSSLLQYLTFNLASWPDWSTFGYMLGLGLAMAAVGIFAFNKRDCLVE